MTNLNLNSFFQEKIRTLKPYQVESANCKINLHANENPFPPPKELQTLFENSLKEIDLNRYPDPESQKLKTILSKQEF